MTKNLYRHVQVLLVLLLSYIFSYFTKFDISHVSSQMVLKEMGKDCSDLVSPTWCVICLYRKRIEFLLWLQFLTCRFPTNLHFTTNEVKMKEKGVYRRSTEIKADVLRLICWSSLLYFLQIIMAEVLSSQLLCEQDYQEIHILSWVDARLAQRSRTMY